MLDDEDLDDESLEDAFELARFPVPLNLAYADESRLNETKEAVLRD
jgi:hypothetical protein